MQHLSLKINLNVFRKVQPPRRCFSKREVKEGKLKKLIAELNLKMTSSSSLDITKASKSCITYVMVWKRIEWINLTKKACSISTQIRTTHCFKIIIWYIPLIFEPFKFFSNKRYRKVNKVIPVSFLVLWTNWDLMKSIFTNQQISQCSFQWNFQAIFMYIKYLNL